MGIPCPIVEKPMHTGPVVLLTEETRRVPSHGAADPVSEGLSALVRVSGPVAIHAPPSELDECSKYRFVNGSSCSPEMPK
jgi:hypothetical protein